MSTYFKDFSDAPTLTLDTFVTENQKKDLPEEVKTTEVAEEKPLDDSALTAEEREMVKNFVAQIDLKNSNVVLQYGSGTQKKMADFSEAALANVRSKDLGEIGELLSSVVTELKCFDEVEQ